MTPPWLGRAKLVATVAALMAGIYAGAIVVPQLLRWRHSLPDLNESTHGQFRIFSNVSEEHLAEMRGALNEAGSRVRAIIGGDRPALTGEVSVYYLRRLGEYHRQFSGTTGTRVIGDLGVCTVDPPRLFGSLEIGNGTIGHELVHVMIHRDWPEGLPGWLDESLAVTLGCPVVKVTNDQAVIPDFHLYMAVRALEEGKWTPLRDVIYRRGAGYSGLDRVKLTFPGGRTYVGPLATGRLFVRWMMEQNVLPAFYRTFRDTHDVDAALAAAFGKELAVIEDEFVAWIRSHREEELIALR